MLFNTTTIVTLFAATVTAGVIPAIKLDPVTWDKNGNIKLTFSRETVKIGTLTTDKIMAAVGPICHESGQCETNPIELKAGIVENEGLEPIKVTLSPDGEYPTWIRNGLVDVLALAVKHVTKCEEASYITQCHGATAMAWCPPNRQFVNNCEVPKFWGINYQAPDSSNAAPPNIGLNVAMEKVDESKLCEDIMTSLGGLAGAVNGYAGGVFTLMSYACV